MLSPTSWPNCPEPRWATRRRPQRKTLGPRVAAVAAKFGQPLMPWQQLVADVGLEYELVDGKVRPFYRQIVMSVPRQNGKTTLVLAFEVDRALSWGVRQRIIYSAQTGKDAREKLLEDQVPILHGAIEGTGPFSPAISKVDKSHGGEAIVFRGGSRISTVASSEAAGHGKTIGLGVVDESFDDVDNRREQALLPAMRTVRDAQLIVCSTMGTNKSIYWNTKVDTCRAIAAEDRDDSRICYFEWSAPDDADIEDPAVWAACSPSLGFTLDLETIAAELEANRNSLGEFMRASLNMRTQSEERVIPLAAWQAIIDPAAMPDGRVAFAVDANPERDSASIAVADSDGNIELVDHEHGLGWVAPRAEQLARKWGAAIALDPSGPAAPVAEELKARGVRVVEFVGRDLAKACGAFYDAVADGKLAIRPNEHFAALDAACSAATKRVSGDTWTWSRKDPTDISPLVAVTLAYWAAQQGIDPVSQVF